MRRASWSRRRFLGATMLGAAALTHSPANAQFQPRVGLLGLGVRGRQLMESCPGTVLAVCDVDRSRLDALTDGEIFKTQDYRELVARADLDGVMIATPHHGHATQAMAALRHGKRVYLEAPAAFTLHESREVELHARQFGRDVHVAGLGVGSAGRLAERLRAWLGDAAIAQVVLEAPLNQQGGDPDRATAAPDTLDWEAWLRPAARRRYNPDYAHLHWRWMMDYGGGMLTQHAPTLLTALLLATGSESMASARVTASGSDPEGPLWDCPASLQATWALDGFPGTIAWRQHAEAGGVRMTVEAAGRSCTIEKTVPGFDVAFSDAPSESIAGSLRDELTGWLNAPGTFAEDFAYAAQAAALVELGQLSYRLGRPLSYDLSSGAIVGDAFANRLVRRHAS